MSAKDFKKIVTDKLSELLKERNFKKKGNFFSLSNGDLTYFIGLQSSQSSTADILKVTINTEIASAVISKLDDISLPIEQQRHYSRRIGFYLDNRQDKWWTIDSINTAEIAAKEMADIINEKVLPNFDALKSTSDLANLWRTNGYIGVTEGQRKNYLNLIDKTRQW
jgi:hypothetical protein